MARSCPTVERFLVDQWLPTIRSTIRETTWISYEAHVRRYFVSALGKKRLDRVQVSDVNLLYAELLKRLSPTTVRRLHGTLRLSFRAAVSWGVIEASPVERATPPRIAHVEMTVWDAGQLRSFLESVRNDALYPLWLTLALTGLRRGEALGLRWVDIDLERSQLRVKQTIVTLRWKIHYSAPKTAKSRRVVALDDETVSVLRSLKAGAKHELVFHDEDGEPLHPVKVSRRFDTLVRRSGLPRIRLHDLRHTHASLALEAGVHPKIVSERLGHSTVAFTLDVYSHALPSLQGEAAGQIARLIFPGSP